ncbi:hypothetical protein BH10PSE17_BH10PSE17_03000 [soil metagenome]
MSNESSGGDAGTRAARIALRMLVLALPLLAVGCASLSEGQCLKGNWLAIGKKDAVNGYPPSRLNDHFDACGEYGVQPDPTLYERGYQQGVVLYCVPQSGFHEGRYNSTYYRQCPREMEGAFLAAWEAGSDVSAIDSQISDLDSRISGLQDKIKDKDTSDDKRKDLRRRVSDLKDERERRQWDRDRLLERAGRRGYL